MLSFLRKILQPGAAVEQAPIESIPPNPPRVPTEAQSAALNTTFDIVLSHLTDEHRDSIKNRLIEAWSTDQSFPYYEINAMQSTASVIDVDWKDSESAYGFSRDIAKTLQIAGEFELPNEADGMEVFAILSAFDTWLMAREHRFVTLNQDADCYVGFIVPEDKVKTLISTAATVAINLIAGPKE